MKLFFLLSVLSFNVLAVDSIKMQIDHLTVEKTDGELTSKEIIIKSEGDSIGFQSQNDQVFEGQISIREKDLKIFGSNGMFMSTSSPVELKDVPKTEIDNALFKSEKNTISFKADSMKTSISNIALDVAQLDFGCNETGACTATAGSMTVDKNMRVKKAIFSCVKDNCLNKFKVNVENLDDGQTLRFRSLSKNPMVTKGLVDLKDLSSINFSREDKKIVMTGKVKIWLIKGIDFELRADIVNLNDDILELSVGKVKIEDFLSVTDLTNFLLRKILASKTVSMNGNNIVIHLK